MMTAAKDGHLINTCINRPVTVTMIMIGLVVFGLVSYNKLPLNLMPELSYPTITVRTTYEGSAPEEIENDVSIPLEEALGVVSNLRRIQSISKSGRSDLLLEFDWKTDMNLAMQEVAEKIETVILPEKAKKPIILRYDPSLDPVMRIILYGGSNLMHLREFADIDLKREIEKLPGVAAVKVRGGLEEEVEVLFNERLMALTNLNIDQINDALSAHNINLSGGKLTEAQTEYIVRTVGEFKSLSEIGDTIIAWRSEKPIRIRDIGEVRRGFRERTLITRVGDNEGVLLDIYREADANIVNMSKTVRRRLLGTGATTGQKGAGFFREEPLTSMLPPGVRMRVISDSATFIKMAISNLKSSAILGAILAILILFLFLKEFSPTIIIALSIPLSTIVTLGLLYIFHISINIMSLGGLAIGVGMLVDNAIVVLESISRCREEGDVPSTAASRGTKIVAMAVTASTLTTVAVFFPIVFVEGIAGQVFKDLSLSVIFSLLSSLAFSLFVVPMLSAREGFNKKTAISDSLTLFKPYFLIKIKEIWSRRKIHTLKTGLIATWHIIESVLLFTLGLISYIFIIIYAFAIIIFGVLRKFFISANSVVLQKVFVAFDSGFNSFKSIYRQALIKLLPNPSVVLLPSILVFILSMSLIVFLDTQVVPAVHTGSIGVDSSLPVGSRVEQTDSRMKNIALQIQELPEVEEVVSISGLDPEDLTKTEGGDYTAHIIINLKKYGNLKSKEAGILPKIRGILSSVPDMSSKVSFPSLFSSKSPIEVEIYSPDMDSLKDLTSKSKAILEGIPLLSDIKATLSSGNPEVQIHYNRELLNKYGLDIRRVAEIVRTKVLGDVKSRYNKGRERVDIRALLQEKDRASISQLASLIINPESSTPIQLSEVANLSFAEGPSEIRRIDQQRVAILYANTKAFGLSKAAGEIKKALSQITWQKESGFRIAGQKRELDRSRNSIILAITLAILLVYLVMASQFESLLHPLLIMTTIPLSMVGVVPALYLFKIPLNVMVFLGILILAGIVVNNAIVLVDYINQLRDGGIDLFEAILEAGIIRMRPILMTTLTTVLGLIPVSLSLGEGAELQSSLAITVMVGLTTSTLLTLIVIPVLYYSVEKNRR